MALLAEPRIRALDNSGNAISGATLTVYETGTTTLSELYSTRALANAGGDGDLANPLTADSAGYFATVFVPNETVVDVILKNSSGTTLWQSNGVTAISDALNSLDIDLDENGRLTVRGSGGLVRLEVGDPEGDDTGGDLVVSGWNATQGTTLEVDFASETHTGNMTVEGTVEIDGRPLDVLYSQGTVSGTNCDIALPQTFVGDAIEAWDVELVHLTANAAELHLQFSYDDGGTFKSGANNYTYQHKADVAASGTYILLTDEMNGGATPNRGVNNLRLMIWGDATHETSAVWEGIVTGAATTTVAYVYGVGMTNAQSFGKPTHIRIKSTSGTVTLTYRVRTRKSS